MTPPHRPSPTAVQLASLLVAVLLVLAAVPAPATADVRGRPNFEAYVADNRFTPGEETTLTVNLLNDATVFEQSETNPGLTDIVTTAQGVRATVRASSAPIEVKTATRAVGNVPEGATPGVDFRVVVDEDARPGRYEVTVRVQYTYTRFVGEEGDSGRPGVRYEEGATQTFRVPVVVEPRARFAVQAVQPDVSVGTAGTVTVALRNEGGAMAENAAVQIESANPAVTLGTGDAPATVFVRSWEAGDVERFTVRTSVDEDAVVRSYALTATVTYDDPDGVRRTAETVQFGVVPARERTFAVGETTSDLRVGEEGRVRGTVENTGDVTATNAVLVLESAAGTLTPTEREVALGTLAPGEAAPFAVEFEVSETADAGDRRLSFVVEHRGVDGATLRSDPLDVQVGVAPERDVFDVTPLDASVRAGGSGTVVLDVTNAGEEPVTDVSVKVFADDPLSASDDEAFVDSLAPGESAEVRFRVAAAGGALAKTYPVSLDLQYDDAEGDTLLTDTYRIPVVVRPGDDGFGLPFSVGTTTVLVGAGLALLAGVVVIARRWRDG